MLLQTIVNQVDDFSDTQFQVSFNHKVNFHDSVLRSDRR